MSSAYEQMRVNIVLGVQGLKNPELARKELQKLGLTAEQADIAIQSLAATTTKNTEAVNVNTSANKKNTIGQELRRKTKEKSVATEKLDTAAVEKNTAATNRNTEGKRRSAALGLHRIEVQEGEKVSTDELTGATERLASVEEMESKILQRLNLKRAEANLLTKNAIAGYSDFYLKLAKAEALGKPALMRTAQWSAVGLVGVAYASIKQYADFNKLLVQSVTHAGRKMSEVPFFSEKLLQISKETGQSAHDLAEAMYRVSSGTAAWNKGLGASKETVIQLTRMVSDLTTIGNIKSGVQQEQAARVITALVNSGMKGIGGEGEKGAAKRAAALINSAIGAGDIKMSEMVSAMGRGVLMSGKSAGLSASDVMSWVDLLTTHGTTGSVAGTYVKTAINQFLNPTAQGAKAYAMVGIDPFTLSSVARQHGLGAAVDLFNQKLTEFNPFVNYPKTKGKEGYAGAVQQLQMWAANQFPPDLLAHWKAGKLSAEEQAKVNSLIFTKAFGGSKGFTTMAMLLGESAQFHNIQTAINRNATTKKFEEAKKLAENTPAMQFQRIKNSVIADLIDMGKTLAPYAVMIGKFAAKTVHFITVFKPLLIGLASWMVIMIGMALKAKAAGLMKSMYGPLGSAYKLTDTIWGKVAKIPGFGWAEKLVGKGGKHYRDIENIETRKIFTKLGQDLAIFGDGAITIDRAATKLAAAAGVDTGPLGGGGGGRRGGGGGAGAPTGPAGDLTRAERKAARAAERAAVKAEREATRAARRAVSAVPHGGLESLMYTPGYADSGFLGRRRMRRDYLARTRDLRRYAQPGAELDFARQYMFGQPMYGKNMTKADIRRHFGLGTTSSDKYIVDDIFNRLNKHRIAGGGFSPESMEIFRHSTRPGYERGSLMTRSEKVIERIAAKGTTGGRFASMLGNLASRGGVASKIIGGVGSAAGGLGGFASKIGGVAGKIGGSGLLRFAGGLGMESMLGLGAGMLTGPFGLAAMTALPLMMPYLASGLRGLFGGGDGQTIDTTGTGASTTAANQKAIDETQKKLNAALGGYNAGKHGKKQVAKIMRLQNQLNRLRGYSKAQSKDNTSFARLAIKNVQASQKVISEMGGGAIMGGTGGTTASGDEYKHAKNPLSRAYTRKELRARGFSEEAINGYFRVMKPYIELSKKRGYGGALYNEGNLTIKNKKGQYIGASAAAMAYFKNTLKLQAGGLADPLLSEAANKVDPNILANLQYNKYKKYNRRLGFTGYDKKHHRLTGDLGAYVAAGNFNFKSKSAAVTRYMDLEQASMESIQQAKGLEKLANQKGLSEANKKRYLAEAQSLRSKAAEYQKGAAGVASANVLTKSDINTLAGAIGRAVAKEYNLKPDDIRQAFVDGLNQASGGLAKLVNSHNTNANART